MKRKLTTSLLLLLILLCLHFICLADGIPTISVAVKNATPGNTVTLGISITNNPGIFNMTIPISYDESVLENPRLVGEGDGWVIGSNAYWENSTLTDSTYNGQILALTFDVKDTAEPGMTTVSVGSIDAWNCSEEQVLFESVSGGVNVVVSDSYTSYIPKITSLENCGSGNGIKISWQTASADVQEFAVWRRAGGDWENIAAVTGTTFQDTDAAFMATMYSYRVTATSYNTGLDEAMSSEEVSIVRNPFTDIQESVSYFGKVAWAYNNSIVNGTSTSTFSPNENCTRIQFTIMLYKLAGKPSVEGLDCPFTDLRGLSTNQRNSVIWAYNQGIINGKSPSRFDPSGNITRANIVLMLYKLAGYPNADGMTSAFTDIDSLTRNNQRAIIWANNSNVVNGTGSTTFSPTDPCTRRQLVTILYKIYYNTPYAYLFPAIGA